MERICLKCGAVFKNSNDEDTIKQLKDHQSQCSRDDNFLDDENAIRYDDFMKQ